MGKFIAIEGMDGVGKTTIVRELANRFSGHAMSTPGEGLAKSRQAVLEALADDELAKALFYMASVSSQGRKAAYLVEQGKWVFMDRYCASTQAYAKARGVKSDFSILFKDMVKPDMTVLLLLDEAERQKRLGHRGSTPEDQETLDPDFRHCVSNELESRADIAINIDGMTIDDVCTKLVGLIIDSNINEIKCSLFDL